MTPATGLKSGQKALVQASGFAGESGGHQCAAKGAATGPGDCDLNGMQSVTSDASGQVKIDLTVTKGPLARTTSCVARPGLPDIGDPSYPSPTQEADTPITFGLGRVAATTISRAMIVTSAARPGALARG